MNSGGSHGLGAQVGILLGKDLKRAWRQPIPYLIQLGVPLLITALLGMVFAGGRDRGSGGGAGSGLGRIRMILVDEDDSPLTRLLRGALNQGEAGKHLEVESLDRSKAVVRLTENQAAAAVILPRHFASDYLTGTGAVRIEVVKNPAQQYHPAIVEELVSVLATGLSALSRNLRPEVDSWREVLNGTTNVTMRGIGERLVSTGERLDQIRKRLDPVPVWYDEEKKERSVGGEKAGGASDWNMFAYLLPGLAAMFLTFLADVAMRDLHRELRLRTFDRCCTLPVRAFGFVLSKVFFTFLIVVIGAGILLGGGSVLFGFRWESPGAVVVLSLAMAVFASGLMAALAGVFPGERKAELLNTLFAMGLGLAGGCAFPSQALPAFLRDYITPNLPPNWFLEAVRATQFETGGPAWTLASAKLVVVGLVLSAVAAWLLRRGLARGART